MDSKIETPTLILVLLGVACLLVPVFGFKFVFLDKTKELNVVKKEFGTVRDNTASISKLMEDPDTFKNFIKAVIEKKSNLLSLRPTKTDLITSQKLLAGLAKQNNVTIISLKPLEDGMAFYLEEPDGASKEDEGKEVIAEEIQLALLEIRVRGEFSNLINYFEAMETSTNATLNLENLNIQLIKEGEEETFIEAVLNVRLYYSSLLENG